MKSLLNNKKELHFHRNCSDCNKQKIIYITYNENDKAVEEFKFKYNDSNKFADVALVNNDNIKFIFEICHKNKTKECNRPEPWVEVDATEFIKKINENNGYNLECIREYRCEDCILAEQERILKYKELQEQIEQERILKIKQQQKEEQERILKIKKQQEKERQEQNSRTLRLIELAKLQKYEREQFENELNKRRLDRLKNMELEKKIENDIYYTYKSVI